VTQPRKPRKRKEQAVVQVGVHGVVVKAKVSPADIGEPTPKNWKQVWKLVHGHLMKLCVDAVGLVADVLGGARRLVRGLADIPPAVAKRIEKAQVQADRAEEKRQEQVAAGQREALPAPIAADRVEDVLADFRAKGLAAAVVKVGDAIAVVAVRPELLEEAVAAARQALLAPSQDDSSTEKIIEQEKIIEHLEGD
jgi:hypothetical protein